MPLRVPDVPPAGLEVLGATIQELVAIPGFVTDNLGSLPLGVPSIALPHHVFHLEPEDLVEGRGLEFARLAGLRFVILIGREVLAAAELSLDGAGTPLDVTGFVKGASVQDFVSGIGLAENLPSVLGGSFEARLLRVPPLHTQALWLKDEGGTGDMLLRLGDDREPQPAPDVLAALRREAERRLAFLGENLVG